MTRLPRPPGRSADIALAIIADHADGQGCLACRDTWCPSSEWALWVVVMDQLRLPYETRRQVTVVARLVMTAHWPRTVEGCRPCGLPDCERIVIAGTWLEVHDRGWSPIAVSPQETPTADQLREITGME